MNQDDLRVHTDPEGIIWCGQHEVGARCTGYTASEFVTKNVFKTAPAVRVMGSSANIKLLLTMYEKHKSALAPTERRIWIASPLLCSTSQLRLNPEEVLYRLWQSDTTARVSARWHSMKSADFNSYLLRSTIEGGSKLQGVTDKAKVIFQYHPAFGALSFFGSTGIQPAMSLLATILDPRWFVHEGRPNRMSRLFKFLGLTQANFEPYITNDKGRNWDKSRLVLNSWSNLRDREVDYTSPLSFLWRIYRYHGGGSRGTLRASEEFVRFIVLHWLEGLNPAKRKLFDPVLFFKTDEEVDAYDAHQLRIRS